jgi:hypothetical protein
MEEARQAMDFAFERGQAGAMVAAVTLRARLSGLLVEDRRNLRTPFQSMSEQDLMAEIERTLHELGLKHLGLQHPT